MVFCPLICPSAFVIHKPVLGFASVSGASTLVLHMYTRKVPLGLYLISNILTPVLPSADRIPKKLRNMSSAARSRISQTMLTTP
ncbi:hypothetical protein BR93DRAFT_400162 [Coniochaeta sp. PMI_546]|nr:hypothetical protein BR93DRAFT_400162 [Coniochaeta sp. PMI_546]